MRDLLNLARFLFTFAAILVMESLVFMQKPQREPLLGWDALKEP